jgi:formylglycine-generating enzyme required for sulfatase activity
MAFAEWLSRKEGTRYRLPTEAEWEYACRAGSTTRYGYDESASSLDDYAWYSRMHQDNWIGTHPVGKKRPNPWGLYDMHGNVWEWCADWFEAEYCARSPSEDPAGPARGSSRVIRGGGCSVRDFLCGASCRANRSGPGQPDVGFRLARLVSAADSRAASREKND